MANRKVGIFVMYEQRGKRVTKAAVCCRSLRVGCFISVGTREPSAVEAGGGCGMGCSQGSGTTRGCPRRQEASLRGTISIQGRTLAAVIESSY